MSDIAHLIHFSDSESDAHGRKVAGGCHSNDTAFSLIGGLSGMRRLVIRMDSLINDPLSVSGHERGRKVRKYVASCASKHQ
jgi:hypothetical protein